MKLEVFQEKYLPLSSRLFSIAIAILGNVEDAEDAVQDTYLRFWEKVERVESIESGEAYLSTMVRNICLNKLRVRHYEQDVEGVAHFIDTTDTTGQDRMEAADNRSFWCKLLAHLSPKARRIVTLRHIGDYSTHDIATLMGETDTNIRVALSRARQKLKEEYLRTQCEAQ